jgi:sigma-B regulation protein RsbU (phosphoserine phosphatase)
LKISIIDDGDGFDIKGLPDPHDPDNLLGESGRGILLSMNAFDEVKYNNKGNAVTLIKNSEHIKSKNIIRNEIDDFNIYNKYKRFEQIKYQYDFELNLASEFQNTFLPKKDLLATLSGIKSDYIFLPLVKVSGDFIDISLLDEGMYGFFISDISGHGVAAALISSMLKVFFSLYAKDVLSPQLLFNMLNSEFFYYLNSGEYFTSFYGIYFKGERKFVYTNANHPAPLLLRDGSDEIIELNTEGFFVGIFENSEFEEQEVVLDKGDRILFYTDGIIEAKNADGFEFGIDNVMTIYKNNANNSISNLINIIKDAVFDFSNNKIEDDITIAIFEVV